MKKVRLAKREEAKEILDVYSSGGAWLPYTDVEEINKSIKENENGKTSLIVVEIEGKIAGALKLHRPQSHIGKGGKVATLPEYRGHGIGKLLYRSAIKIFDLEGRRKVTDSLIGENPAILKIFEDLGFEIEAKMRKHTPAGKTLYQFAYHIDEKGVPELGEDVEFDIPITEYMKELKEKNKEHENNPAESD
ncbi:MAG TPA: GNAT family N-acetyltransferase [Candidatus Omnitrophota bacterium]|nr:GNAT family N-acetyltransferase [Candidatus Omnitrophota bacterium]